MLLDLPIVDVHDMLSQMSVTNRQPTRIRNNQQYALWKVKNQPDATKYVVLLPQHVSGTKHAHHQEYNEAIKLYILSHLVGSLPFTKSTKHGHMNIKYALICTNL
jgi:hypothetical protein